MLSLIYKGISYVKLKGFLLYKLRDLFIKMRGYFFLERLIGIYLNFLFKNKRDFFNINLRRFHFIVKIRGISFVKIEGNIFGLIIKGKGDFFYIKLKGNSYIKLKGIYFLKNEGDLFRISSCKDIRDFFKGGGGGGGVYK